MTNKPTSFPDVLDLLGSPAKASEALGIKYVTAQVMFHRKSIGDAHWPRLVAVLADRGIDITTDDLLAMKHAKKAEGKSAGAVAA